MGIAGLLAAAVFAQASWSVGAAVEPARESLRYRFENPSSFNTEALVPHFFVQTYDTDNTWGVLRVAHPAGRHRGELRVAISASATRRADDFDTFFNPDGNVIVAGTTGNASLRGWEIRERLVSGAYRGMDVGFVLGYRRDTARYHEGTGIVTTTLPPTRTERLVTTREFVTSQLLEVGVFAERRWTRATALLAVVPAGGARLRVDLPDKYPGRPFKTGARFSSLDGEVSYRQPAGPVGLRLGARFARVFGWRNSASVRLARASVFLELSAN